MSYSTFIAKRYLHSGRNQGFFSFITAISILGVMLGTATLIIALSVLGGFEKEITEKVVGFTSHVQVLGFQNQPLRKSTQNAELIRRSIPVVNAVSPFVAREALIRFREEVDGICSRGSTVTMMCPRPGVTWWPATMNWARTWSNTRRLSWGKSCRPSSLSTWVTR